VRWRPLALSLLALLAVSDLAAAQAKIREYREPPFGACKFAVDQFHVELDTFQEETLKAWVDPAQQRIALQAAAGVGKSAVMSWSAWHFLAVECLDEYQHPKGLVTGVTDANLRDNFWAEMAKWQAVSPWLTHAFEWSDQRIAERGHPETWFLGRRNWPKSGNEDQQGATLSGLHSVSVAAFVDESGSIPPAVGRAAEQALADGPRFGKIMQSGNPISLAGMLYEAATKKRHLSTIIVVTNDPDDPKRAKRGNVAWAREQIALYGRENPWVKSYILGQFPPNSPNALLGLEDVTRAFDRVLKPDAYDHMQKRIGVDVARFGDDRTVLWPRQGLASFNPVVMRGADTNQIVGRVMLAVQRWGADLVLIDNSFQWGNGCFDNLVHAGQNPHPVDFAGKALDKRFANRRAEGWMLMAEAIKTHGAGLPRIDALVDELTTPTYHFQNGVFQLEPKEEIKKRLGRSPDLADALAITYMLPDMPRGLARFTGGATTSHAATDYDPYAEGGR